MENQKTSQTTSQKKSLSPKVLIITGIIILAVIAVGIVGYLQYQQYQTRQAIIQTNKALYAYTQAAAEVDAQMAEFDDLNAVDPSNYTTVSRRFNDEYDSFEEDYQAYQEQAENLRAQIETAPSSDLESYYSEIAQLEEVTSKELAITNDFLNSSREYISFVAEVDGSEIMNEEASENGSDEEVIALLEKQQEEINRFKSELEGMEDLPYYEDMNQSFADMMVTLDEFYGLLIESMETRDYSLFMEAMALVENLDTDFTDLDFYQFEKLADESDERIELINDHIDTIAQIEEELAQEYSIDVEGDEITPVEYEKQAPDSFFLPTGEPGESEEEAIEAYTL